ncbi:MAG: MarR family transcriptional regulator, lower aerobic nicotinate degradation pathway regulator, partial [Micromonosporaceae bacterium]
MRAPVEATAPARFTNLPGWLITQTAQHVHRLVSEGMAAVGARGYHYRALACLDEFGPASQADLGRRSGIHLSDLVATINEL